MKVIWYLLCRPSINYEEFKILLATFWTNQGLIPSYGKKSYFSTESRFTLDPNIRSAIITWLVMKYRFTIWKALYTKRGLKSQMYIKTLRLTFNFLKSLSWRCIPSQNIHLPLGVPYFYHSSWYIWRFCPKCRHIVRIRFFSSNLVTTSPSTSRIDMVPAKSIDSSNRYNIDGCKQSLHWPSSKYLRAEEQNL